MGENRESTRVDIGLVSVSLSYSSSLCFALSSTLLLSPLPSLKQDSSETEP